ncbi:hypothetical protein [Leptotrichia sp. oral taxon 879]|jgi:hypothetical protein|uniref:HEPN domain-containing protein n=1 Tax=Leptotrichia mesophila TaxID=3239303 RepID=A0AB39V980_9FUSO|nr:hypothetical protein [Leptotrichia sp. oral taxon 879]ERK47702.1 hypothetical protein HMPREF1552_02289 [Leptotrichia sp. oral taxon 879 str. F0557]
MSLLDKSNQNFEIAEDAAKKGYFDTAVSRLYYSSFQRMNNFIDQRKSNNVQKITTSDNQILGILGKGNINQLGSHEKKFLELCQYDNSMISIMSYIINMKIQRKIADYKEQHIIEQEYQNIKIQAEFINNYIDNNL